MTKTRPRDFLKKSGNGKAKPNATSEPENGKGGSFARILDGGVSNGAYGERFFLNVDMNGLAAGAGGRLPPQAGSGGAARSAIAEGACLSQQPRTPIAAPVCSIPRR